MNDYDTRIEYFTKRILNFYKEHNIFEPIETFNEWFRIKDIQRISSYDNIVPKYYKHHLDSYGIRNEKSCGLSIGLLVEFYRRENEVKCVAIKELMNMHNRDAKIYAEIFDKAKKDAENEYNFNKIMKLLPQNKAKTLKSAADRYRNADKPHNPVLEMMFPKDTSRCLKDILKCYKALGQTEFLIYYENDDGDKILPTRNLLGAILTYE